MSFIVFITLFKVFYMDKHLFKALTLSILFTTTAICHNCYNIATIVDASYLIFKKGDKAEESFDQAITAVEYYSFDGSLLVTVPHNDTLRREDYIKMLDLHAPKPRPASCQIVFNEGMSVPIRYNDKTLCEVSKVRSRDEIHFFDKNHNIIKSCVYHNGGAYTSGWVWVPLSELHELDLSDVDYEMKHEIRLQNLPVWVFGGGSLRKCLDHIGQSKSILGRAQDQLVAMQYIKHNPNSTFCDAYLNVVETYSKALYADYLRSSNATFSAVVMAEKKLREVLRGLTVAYPSIPLSVDTEIALTQNLLNELHAQSYGTLSLGDKLKKQIQLSLFKEF